ncbi:MAG: hypothetical protein K2M13_08875 [Muribaculaceae bacterium]|nr:hypothetical protein [Muribaculaceae bacterium]
MILLSLIPLTCLYSCSDELPVHDSDGDTTDGVEISVPISLSVAPMRSGDPGSRATYIEATDDEKKITDFWLIEYNENGVRVGLPRYFEVEGEAHTSYTLDNINIIVPREEGQNYTCVLMANTRDASMFGEHNRAKFSTLDALRNFDKDVTNQEDLFKPAENRYLLMSGWIHITKDTRKLEFDLIRNVSKVKVKLTAFPENKLVPKYFQWCDVPFAKLFPHGTNANYKQKVSRNWRQHDDFQIIRDDDGYDYYIPCNSWIPEDISVSSDNGTTVREEDPTYFDIVCRLNSDNVNADDVPIDDHELYKFSIYPSRDKEKQFNFKPNHYYEIEVAINDIPDPDEDPFFNKLGYTDLRGANCYIIDPNAKDVFKLHLDQINEFWRQYNGKDLLDDDPNNENNEWVAEVIWQDTDVRIFDFSFVDDEDSEKDLTKFDGHGNTYFTFCPSHSGTGNVIVGVRKRVPENEIPPRDKREYFWSWHIWITDYKPDEHPDKWTTSYNEWLSDKYVYPVTGGEVHTYLNSIWEATTYNIIKHRFMMDRNLGAWSANPDDGYRTFGFYYQRGRKDPFPIADSKIQKVYDIDGNEIDVFNVGLTNMISEKRQATIADGVKYPYKLFESPYQNSPDWYDDPKDYQFDSGWLNGNVDSYTKKSIFDPCPPGWMLPPPDAYAIQQDGTFGPKSGGKINKNNLGIDFNFYTYSPQTIWFPLNCTRGTGPQTGYYWTAPTKGMCVFNFADPTVGGRSTTSVNNAGIRCITVPSNK